MATRSVRNDYSEFMDSTGSVMTLCVLHELDPDSLEAIQAVTFVYGMSVCRKHLKTVVDQMLEGYSLSQIIKETRGGQQCPSSKSL